jgi:hypothetical protein
MPSFTGGKSSPSLVRVHEHSVLVLVWIPTIAWPNSFTGAIDRTRLAPINTSLGGAQSRQPVHFKGMTTSASVVQGFPPKTPWQHEPFVGVHGPSDLSRNDCSIPGIDLKVELHSV